METILSETYESYAQELVVPLKSNGGEMEDNVERIIQWMENWKAEGAGHTHHVGQAEDGSESDS